MIKFSENRNCKTCMHYVLATEKGIWFCKLNSLEDMLHNGFTELKDNLPNPEEFICEDYEPP